MSALEIFGYAASVLIAISLMTANIKRLRWLNLAGSFSFSVYGLLIDAYPVFVLNGWIALVNVYFLWRLYRFKDSFDLVQEASASSPVYSLLLNRYGDDIARFFPAINTESLRNACALLVFRNMKPVGLFAYEPINDGRTANVLVDYVIPEARDFKTAQFLFDRHLKQLKEDNFKALKAHSNDSSHTSYLLKMGFVAKDDGYQLAL
jgi:hypothetical protein